MKEFFDIDSRLLKISDEALKMCKNEFDAAQEISAYNQNKVLSAFIKNNVSESHLGTSTGYGYGDRGREVLDRIIADTFGAEDAIIRHNFVSGTHTLSVALFGILRPGDTMICITGRPYDTLIGVLGIDGYSDGSLSDFGVNYDEVPLTESGTPNTAAIEQKLKSNKYKMAYIQRSRGYSTRPSLSIKQIKELCSIVHEISPDTVVMVDNCYGEFVEKLEPTQVGADLMAGSLIKNAGGGIAPTGGYIAGRSDLVEKCSYRLTCAGLGRELGATLGHNRELFLGFFLAPQTVGEAVKTAIYASALFEKLGYGVSPRYCEHRADIVQVVTLGNEAGLIAFCEGMQMGAPVDSFVRPEPSDMPGYDNKVIMAAGTFTLGASIELSADAPMREPFAAWMQGGLTFPTAQTGVLLAADSMVKKGVLTLK